jgi:hypothetical protein
MKILIITTRRSGGTALGTWISTEIKLDYVYEPDITGDFIKDNTVVKLIYLVEYDQQIRDLSKNFDKVIIHKRCDIEKQAESLAYSKANEVYDEKYSILPIFFKKHKELYDRCYRLTAESNEGLDRLNFGIHTEYERIFLNFYGLSPLLEYLEIPKPEYLYILDSDRKYRYDKLPKFI